MPNRLGRERLLFERRIGQAEQLVTRCAQARHSAQNRLALTRAELEIVHEIALLKAIVASEQFLERTLGLYVLGTRSPSGYRARRLHQMRGSLTQVLTIFRGDKTFVGWNSPTVVIARASRWLRNGEPFQSHLAAASQFLTYMRKMRNAVAHDSDNAQEEYEDATRRLYGALPIVVSPGYQLMNSAPPALPAAGPGSLFTTAMAIYRGIASRIAP